jgi:hypothetical protein
VPATVVAERIGWEHSIRLLRTRVSELRPACLPPDPSSRTAYGAGEIAQCDFWLPDIELPVGFGQVRRPNELPVLTMVCGYSGGSARCWCRLAASRTCTPAGGS